MNKKQMKKEQERLKRERKQVMTLNNESDIKTVLFVSLGVVVFIGIVFVLINIFNGTWTLFTRENTPISDQGENRVMCGTMFEIEEPEYLVLAYDFSADDAFVYETYIGTYNMFAGIYSLDLNSALNNSCVGEKTNITKELEGLQLSAPTLLKIKDGKIVSSYVGRDKIKDYLESIRIG